MVKGTKAAITKKTGGFIGTTVGKIVVVCITGGVIGCVAAGIINANNDNASGEAVSSVSTSSINSSSSSSSSIISSEEKNELTSTEIYTSIIDQYNSAISVFLAGESVTLDDYPDVNPYIFTEEYTSEPSFYYAYRDLDGNGVNELFVGIDSAYTNDESGSIISPDKIDIVSAYTIKDSKATQFLKTKQFTGISEVIPHYFVSNDNTIIQEGTELWFSDGADGTLLTTLTLSADILNMSDYLFHYNEGGAPHFWTDVKEAKAVPLLAPSSNASIELTDSDYAYYIGYNDFSFLEWGNDNSDVLNLDNKISEDEYFSKIAEYKNNVISLEWTKFNMDSNGYSTESSSTSTTEVQSDHSVFDTVLESYKDFIYNNNHYAKYISDYIIPYEEDENFVSDYNASFYYSYIDLNSDGSDELIIAYKTDDNTNYHLVSIFNTDGTTINQCDSWSANGSGRTYSELTTDGYISFVAMGSVREEDFSVTYQKILNDGTFREEESYSGSYAALDYHPALSLNNFSWQPL